jgi:long-chain acyl-CoA synthetase
MGVNLGVLITDAARRAPDVDALRVEERTLTYAELNSLSDSMAHHLAGNGIEPGDRVGVMLPNVPEFAIAYYGVLKAGGVVVPMNVLLKSREVAFYLSDSGAKAMVAWGDMLDEALAGARQADVSHVLRVGGGAGATSLDEALASPVGAQPLLVQRGPDDTAVILYTSGTTGLPKGAQLTHSNLLWNAEIAAELFEFTSDDVVLGTLPLFHSFGQTCALNATMRRRATVVLIPRFEPEAVLETIEERGVTVFLGVPTMYVALLHADSAAARDLSRLRLCVSGGAAIPVEVLHGFEHQFGARVLEGYGLSETSPVASFNHLDRPSKPGSIGTPVWGTELQVVGDDGTPLPAGEVGEIIVRGHHVMRGYWKRPEDTAAAIDADGWLRTGDMARIDDEGYVFIVDRKKELIIRGGYNVYPREIEEVIYEHPSVLEVAVLGVPHAHLGEEVAAAVVARPGAQIDPAELRAWIKERVAAYRYPRHIVVVDALPKGSTGKILKRELDQSLFATDGAKPAEAR